MRNVFDFMYFSAKARNLFWGGVSIAILSVFFFFFHEDRDPRKGIFLTKTNSYIEGLRIVSKKDGVDSWVLTARKADFSRDETIAQMDSVTMDIKKEGVNLTADRGIYHMNTKDLILENNIMVRLKDSVISATRLSWNPSDGMLTSDGMVHMEGKKFTIEGEGLAATEDNKVKLLRNVKAIFN
jgi:LPS export ABC transporter protein LptC